jgi:hypothetical protein
MIDQCVDSRCTGAGFLKFIMWQNKMFNNTTIGKGEILPRTKTRRCDTPSSHLRMIVKLASEPQQANVLRNKRKFKLPSDSSLYNDQVMINHRKNPPDPTHDCAKGLGEDEGNMAGHNRSKADRIVIHREGEST